MGTVICIRRRKRQQHGTCEKPGDAETGDPVLSENGYRLYPFDLGRPGERVDGKYLEAIEGLSDDPDGYNMIIELKESGAPVGTCCAYPENGNYDIGYSIAKDHWKEGLGTEMIGALLQWIRAEGGKSVSGEVADDNKASVALLHKFGFTEGRKTRYKKVGEETWFDAHILQLELE